MVLITSGPGFYKPNQNRTCLGVTETEPESKTLTGVKEWTRERNTQPVLQGAQRSSSLFRLEANRKTGLV